MEWPGNSPDLNPIENAWKLIKARVKEAKPTSLPHLQKVIEDVWYDMDIHYFRCLVESMPRRMQDVIKAKGDMTKY